MSDRPASKKSISGTRAVDAPLLVGTIAGTRRPRVEVGDEVVIDGRRLTLGGGWLSIHNDAARIHPAIRTVEVHLRLVMHEALGGDAPSADVFVDRVRVSDIEWRSVSAFLAGGAEAWASHLLEEIRTALSLPPSTPAAQRRA